MLVVYLNKRPRYGMLSTYGIPLSDFVILSWINPPKTTVAPLGIVTVVVKRWLLIMGTSFPEIGTLAPRVSLICAIFRVTSLLELIRGMTSRRSSTFSY